MGSDEEPGSAVPLSVEVTSADGKVLLQQQASAAPRLPLVVDVPRPLRSGDRICVRGARHLAVRLDPNLNECLIHVPDGQLQWTVPAEAIEVASASEKTPEDTPYPPSTFQSKRPRLYPPPRGTGGAGRLPQHRGQPV